MASIVRVLAAATPAVRRLPGTKPAEPADRPVAAFTGPPPIVHCKR